MKVTKRGRVNVSVETDTAIPFALFSITRVKNLGETRAYNKQTARCDKKKKKEKENKINPDKM